MLIHVARHGQPAVGDLPAGADHEFPPGDPPLTALGRKQAALLGHRVAQLEFRGTIYASPYRRTLETAEIAAAILDCAVTPEWRLQEYVQVEGRPEFDVLSIRTARTLYPHVLCDARLPSPWLVAGPEGPEDVLERVTPLMESLIRKQHGDVLLIGHGASVNACREAILCRGGRQAGAPRGHNWNCSLSTYRVDRDGNATCIRSCDVSHLPEAEVTSNATSFRERQAAPGSVTPPDDARLPATDFHIHATAYRLGNPKPDHTLRAVVDRCAQVGIEVAGVVEHLNASPRHPLSCLEALVRDFEALAPSLCIYVGAEVDILDKRGTVSCSPAIRDRLGLHYVLGAVHLGPDDLPDIATYIEEEYYRMVGVIEHNPLIDVIAHPWGEGFRWEKAGRVERWTYALIPEQYREDLIEKAVAASKALELSFAGRNRLDDKAYREFVSLARSSGVRVALGSDAHDLEGIGRTVEGTRRLEELGFGPQHLWAPSSSPWRS